MVLQGTGAPPGANAKERECVGRQTNTSQSLPYGSADMEDFRQVYEDLEVVFRDFFAWCRATVSFRFHLFASLIIS